MSTQASVHSIQALKDFRVALALFAEDVLASLGAVDMELKRTVHWLQYDRRFFWQEQIKRRQQKVAEARAEVFRRTLSTMPGYSPAYSEQKELLRLAEASLRDAEKRAVLVKKWEPALQHAILEYHASSRRISDLASGDVPAALVLLERLIDALEAYVRVAPPASLSSPLPFESIAGPLLEEGRSSAASGGAPEPAAGTPEVEPAPAPTESQAEPRLPDPPA